MAAGQIIRNSKLGCLVSMRRQGFCPAVVIDVGAQTGTDALYLAFPNAKHLMIEPVAEHRASLMKLAARLKDAEVITVAAGSVSGETQLHVSENARYAHTSDSAEPEGNLPEVRKIACTTIDDLCRSRSLNGPFLVKIDVDGRESDVLQGMTNVLHETECVIVETIFFGDGPNNFYRVVDFMKHRDFVVYDIVEPLYRPVDFALWQVDTIFVKRQGGFRKLHEYADETGMRQLTTD